MQIENLEEKEEELIALRRRFFRKFDKLVMELTDLKKEVDSFEVKEEIEFDKIISIKESEGFIDIYKF